MENVEKKPKSTKNTNAKDVEKKVSTSKASKANATTQDRAVKSNASKQSASKRGAKTEPKQTDEVVKGQEVAVDTANVERNSSSDDFSIQSQGERIKKNAGKNSKRKKAAIATAVVLLVTASVAIPTAVYLSRRKVSVDIANNIDIIQEYTVNVNRGSTIKDIVPQEITGYTFVGFYKDAELTVPYKDTDKINKNMTIYAKYEANVYKVTFPTSPAFTIEGEDIVNNQVEIEYNTEYRFKLNLATGYDESNITVKVNGETVTPDQDGYYTLTIYGDTLVEVEGVKINTYDVTFYDSLDKNEMYLTLDIDYNQLCTYTGITPTKHSTHTYTYKFIGWVDAEGNEVDLSTTRIVTDLELFANFREEYIEYTISKPEQVNVKFGDLYLSNTATLHYGDIVEITYDTTEGHDVTAFSVSGAEKVEGSENQYKITGNLVVTYTEEIQTFTVQIESSNSEYGSINQSSITVEYGTTYTVEGNVLRFSDGQTVTATPEANTAQYTYTFLDWTSESGTVTGEATITANFARETNTYTVSIQSNNAEYGTVTESSITVEYGTEITVSGNTITIGDTAITATPSIDTAQYSYSFASWSTGDTTVTGAMLITANFTREINTYTVTWKNWDGSTLETDTLVPYGTTPEYNGETPTREETASHSYTFIGWDQEISPVTGDITYTAIFDSEIKASYDFTIEDGIITSYTGNDTYVVLPSTYSLADMVETRSATLTFEDYSNFDGSDFANAPMAIRLMYLGGFYCTINGGERTFYKNIFEFTEAMNTLDPDWSTNESFFPIQIDGATYEIALNGTDDGQEAIGYAFQSIPIAMMMAEGLGKPFNIIFDDGTTLENQTSYEHAYTQMMTIIEQKIQELASQNPDITEEELIDQIYRFKFTTAPYRTGTVVAGDDFEVTGIADGVFANSDIETIRISENIATIGTGILSGCSNLKEIIFSATNCETTLNSFIGLSNSVTITVTSNVKRIPSYFLVEVSNDSSGTTSDDLTLSGLIDLDLKIEDGIVYDSIGDYGFYGRTNLTNIDFSDQATYIGAYAFSGCTNLAEINLPSTSNITYIGNNAFEGTAISTITIPENVLNLGSRVFKDCTNLKEVIYAARDCSVSTGRDYSPFIDLSANSTLIISNTVRKIPDNFLTYNTGPNYYGSLYSGGVIISDDNQIEEIGDGAFTHCSINNVIYLSENLTSVGLSAFSSCGITDVYYAGDINDWVSISFAADRLYGNGANPAGNLYINNELVTEAYIDKATTIRTGSLSIPNLTKVTIGGQVTNIEDSAFIGCYALTNIVFEENSQLTIIGVSAFQYCSSLTSIIIPEGVTSIGSYAFSGCSSLTSITIPDSVTSIGNYAFQYCYRLVYVVNKSSLEFNVGDYSTNSSGELLEIVSDESEVAIVDIDGNRYKDYNGERYFIKNLDGSSEIEIDSSCTQIYQYAFYDNANITSVTIPNSVISIGVSAFQSCSSLTSVTIGDGVTSIGSSAFSYCYSLVYVVNKSSLEFNAGNYGTSSSWGLLEIVSDESEVVFIDIDGNRYKDYNGERYFIKNLDGSSEIEIDSSCTQIYQYAFYDRDDITSVTIPNSVTSIGERAFDGCTSLTDVYYTGDINDWVSISFGDSSANPLSNGVNLYINGNELVTEANIDTATSIGNYAFYGFSSLTSVTIGDGVTSIGDWAFSDCSSLTSVTIGDGVTSIGEYAFYGCTSLTSITIPSSVTSIGRSAFSNCTSLTSITISDSVTSIGVDAFYRCSNLEYNIKDGIKYLGNETNQYLWLIDVENTSQSTYTIDENCMHIYHYAFYECSSLTSITIPDSVTSIGVAAFQRCTSLTSITIPDSVTSIGNYAFQYCSNLTSVTIGEGVTSIGEQAFSGCSRLTSVTIESNYAYKSATSISACGYLLRYAKEVRVLISCIGDSTNRYLENANNFTKTTSEDELYYIYTKN